MNEWGISESLGTGRLWDVTGVKGRTSISSCYVSTYLLYRMRRDSRQKNEKITSCRSWRVTSSYYVPINHRLGLEIACPETYYTIIQFGQFNPNISPLFLIFSRSSSSIWINSILLLRIIVRSICLSGKYSIRISVNVESVRKEWFLI